MEYFKKLILRADPICPDNLNKRIKKSTAFILLHTTNVCGGPSYWRL